MIIIGAKMDDCGVDSIKKGRIAAPLRPIGSSHAYTSLPSEYLISATGMVVGI